MRRVLDELSQTTKPHFAGSFQGVTDEQLAQPYGLKRAAATPDVVAPLA